MKVLNLYAGIGGNRKLWEDVDVTAVEKDPKVAEAYQNHFPQDRLIVDDAHQYLLDYYKEYDFIWSSPPCPTHSRARFWGWAGENPVYPDMKLYQEVLFLKHHASCKWVVENVIPYYKPLLPAQQIGRHLFWSNFTLGRYDIDESFHENENRGFAERYGFDLYPGIRKKGLRNCVHPEIGKYILDRARDIVTRSSTQQAGLFDG